MQSRVLNNPVRSPVATGIELSCFEKYQLQHFFAMDQLFNKRRVAAVLKLYQYQWKPFQFLIADMPIEMHPINYVLD